MLWSRSSTVLLLFSSLWFGTSQAQDLQALYAGKQPFALRDVAPKSGTAFYNGAVAMSANRISAAEVDLQKAIVNDPSPGRGYEAHDLLANMYFRNGAYRQSYKEVQAAIKAKSGDTDAMSMLSVTAALNALPETKVLESKPARVVIDPGEIFLPLRMNGHDLSFFFDTGANISVIGESTAKELGLPLTAVEGKMGDSSGQGVSGLRLALASDLHIAGLHVQNVPFIVVSDDGDPWQHLPKSKHGIIGLPLLLAMKTIRWSPAGLFEMGFPSRNFNLQRCNVLFQNSNPVVNVTVESKRLDFTLDTGAVNTDFNPAFAKALPDLMKSGTPEKQTIEGLGGKVEENSVLLPVVTMTVGGQHVELRPVHVFTSQGVGTWAAGNLGMDVLKQAHAFTLDFESMTLILN